MDAFYGLSRDSILSPLESVDLDIEFLAHTTTPKGPRRGGQVLFNVTRQFNFWTDPGPLQLSGSRPHLEGIGRMGFFLRCAVRCAVPPPSSR